MITEDMVEVVESDWVSVHTVALRVLPAVITRNGPGGMESAADVVADAYTIAECFVEVRARMQKAEYEATERERVAGSAPYVEGEYVDLPPAEGGDPSGDEPDSDEIPF